MIDLAKLRESMTTWNHEQTKELVTKLLDMLADRDAQIAGLTGSLSRECSCDSECCATHDGRLAWRRRRAQ